MSILSQFGFGGQGQPHPGQAPHCHHGHHDIPCDKLLELCSDLMQGNTDPAKIMSFLSSTGTHFWKGAVVGALLALVLGNSSVKSTLADSFSGLFGKGNESE